MSGDFYTGCLLSGGFCPGGFCPGAFCRGAFDLDLCERFRNVIALISAELVENNHIPISSDTFVEFNNVKMVKSRSRSIVWRKQKTPTKTFWISKHYIYNMINL